MSNYKSYADMTPYERMEFDRNRGRNRRSYYEAEDDIAETIVTGLAVVAAVGVLGSLFDDDNDSNDFDAGGGSFGGGGSDGDW